MIKPKTTLNLAADRAASLMRIRNRSVVNGPLRNDLTVMVDGPEDGKFSLMPLRDANGFGYTFASA